MSMLVIILILAAIIALGITLTRKKVEYNEPGVSIGPGEEHSGKDDEPRPDDEEHADDLIEKE